MRVPENPNQLVELHTRKSMKNLIQKHTFDINERTLPS
jgi:hypothetical protein